MANTQTEAWARNIIQQAFERLGVKPTLAMLQIGQAIGKLESYYGKASNPPEWAGSHNWGAVQCCKPDAEGNCPEGSFESKDSSPFTGGYTICFKSYPDDVSGAADMLRIAMHTQGEKDAFASGNVLAVSTAMYDAHYYEGFSKDRNVAIATHAKKLSDNIRETATALGEPIAAVLGTNPPTGGIGGDGAGGIGLLALFGLGALALSHFAVGAALVGASVFESREDKAGDLLPSVYMPSEIEAMLRDLDRDSKRLNAAWQDLNKRTVNASKDFQAHFNDWQAWFADVQAFIASNPSAWWASTSYKVDSYRKDLLNWEKTYEQDGGQPITNFAPPSDHSDGGFSLGSVVAMVVAGIVTAKLIEK